MSQIAILQNNPNDSKILDKIVIVGQRKAIKSTKENYLTFSQLNIIQ